MHADRLTSFRGIASLTVVMLHSLLLFRLGDYPATAKEPFQHSDPLLTIQ